VHALSGSLTSTGLRRFLAVYNNICQYREIWEATARSRKFSYDDLFDLFRASKTFELLVAHAIETPIWAPVEADGLDCGIPHCTSVQIALSSSHSNLSSSL
jgi:hypothetical protein